MQVYCQHDVLTDSVAAIRTDADVYCVARKR